jgi:hypothetical protein
MSIPCPTDELVPEIRKIGKKILVRDIHPGSQAHGDVITADRLNELADHTPKNRRRMWLFSWEDSDEEWLLVEDRQWDRIY